MNISLTKIQTLTTFKIKELLKHKTFLISIIMVPGFVLLYRIVFSQMGNGDAGDSMQGYLMQMGVLMSTCMVSLMMTATLLAKDKEKNTLRTLMTSSVSAADYFVSLLLPITVISLGLNLLIVLISGVSFGDINLPVFLLVNFLAIISGCILGMIVGIFSKNQMSAGNNTVAFMMLLMLLPMLKDVSPSIEKISDFLFTGIVSKLIDSFFYPDAAALTVVNWVTLVATAVVLTIIFLYVYKKHGFEKE